MLGTNLTRRQWIAVGVIVMVVIFMEMDRRYSHKWAAYDYYISNFPLCGLGLMNTTIRALTPHHTSFMALEHFPQHRLFEEHWQAIRDEALHVYHNYQLPRFHDLSKVFDPISGDKWRVFVLKWYDGEVEANTKLCPRTTALLRQCPTMHAAMFSILEPGMYIPPHRGPSKACLRYQLGLSIPSGTNAAGTGPADVHIDLDNKRYHWHDGESVLFDDNYTHSVVNDSTEPRIVFFADVERPLPWPFSSLMHMLNKQSRFSRFISEINQHAEVTQKL
jgi:aspartyl/asparaginyl beta-hydroxylase (cupin superfamily)